MSQQQHEQGPATSGRYSKRKRERVNYYIEDSDIEDVERDDGSHDLVEYSPSKKRKSIRPLPQHKVFPFLQLPAELRNMIYDHCLCEPNGINLLGTTKNYRRTIMRVPGKIQEDLLSTRPKRLVPSILALNQQIYKESRKVLYGNHFKVVDPMTLHFFMVNIGPRAASWIKTITVASWGGWRGMHKAYNHASFAAMISATNIEKLRVEGYLYCKNHPKWIARQIYRDGFPWLEAVGVAKGRVDAAVDLIEVSEDNFRGRWHRRTEPHDYGSDMQDFRDELAKLLSGHMKRMLSPPAKKGKKGKKSQERADVGSISVDV